MAHRLDTVIEYDKILVLGGGEVVAFDTPHKLSLEENGVFASSNRNKAWMRVDLPMKVEIIRS